MAVRLFPEPAHGCTPFVLKDGVYQRYLHVDGKWHLLRLDSRRSHPRFATQDLEWHQRMPNREMVAAWLRRQVGISRDFRHYVDTTVVVPTFSMCAAEALTRVFMRQIVTARQARRMFSDFVQGYGYLRDGVIGFPAPERFRRLSPDDFRGVGLGFRSERLVQAAASLRSFEMPSLGGLLDEGIPGIGPWSRAVLAVEAARDYSRYPFEDKSGAAINALTGADVLALATVDRRLAADLYVYGASYVESSRN